MCDLDGYKEFYAKYQSIKAYLLARNYWLVPLLINNLTLTIIPTVTWIYTNLF